MGTISRMVLAAVMLPWYVLSCLAMTLLKPGHNQSIPEWEKMNDSMRFVARFVHSFLTSEIADKVSMLLLMVNLCTPVNNILNLRMPVSCWSQIVISEEISYRV